MKDPVLYSKPFYVLMFLCPTLFALSVVTGLFNVPFFNVVISVASWVIFLWAFIEDWNKLTASENHYCPHWGWYWITPVYFYKRQSRNNASMGWFWLYMVINFILPGIVILFTAGAILAAIMH